MDQFAVSVGEADFSIERECDWLAKAAGHDTGAIATFTGCVRAQNGGDPVVTMEIEHYPGMTEKSIGSIVEEARRRFSLLAVSVIHRVGRLHPGNRIVFVGVASAHRTDAFAACEFIMDYLKTHAPFWKKEQTDDGERWVEVRGCDAAAAARWRR